LTATVPHAGEGREAVAPDDPEAPPLIGIIGGMGPWAGLHLAECILREWPVEREQDYPHLLIDSDPRVPDRTAAVLGKGADPYPYLRASALRLKNAGARWLVMACNTAHYWYQRLNREFGPVVSIVDAAADAAARKVLGGAGKGRKKVGILATKGTVSAGLYQRALSARGVECVVPDAVHQDLLMDAIYGPEGVKMKGPSSPRGADVSAVMAHLRGRGAGIFILGCTELPLVVPAGKETVEPMEETARRLVRMAGRE